MKYLLCVIALLGITTHLFAQEDFNYLKSKDPKFSSLLDSLEKAEFKVLNESFGVLKGGHCFYWDDSLSYFKRNSSYHPIKTYIGEISIHTFDIVGPIESRNSKSGIRYSGYYSLLTEKQMKILSDLIPDLEKACNHHKEPTKLFLTNLGFFQLTMLTG